MTHLRHHIDHHLFRKWLVEMFGTNYDLNQWWIIFCTIGKKIVKFDSKYKGRRKRKLVWLSVLMVRLAVIFNTLRPRQNGRHFTDNILKCIFFDENVWIPIKISLKFVPKGPIDNIPALVQIMAWRRPGDKQLSEPMMVVLPTHICVTRPQWVNRHSAHVCIVDVWCLLQQRHWRRWPISPSNVPLSFM